MDVLCLGSASGETGQADRRTVGQALEGVAERTEAVRSKLL